MNDLFQSLYLQSRQNIAANASKEGQAFFDRTAQEIEEPAIYDENTTGWRSYLIAKAAKEDAIIAYEVVTGQPYTPAV